MSLAKEIRKGAAVVVLNDRSEVLLQKREDFRLWDLPGGIVETGESTESSAMREVFEETGFTVELDSLASVYHMPQWNAVTYIYRGHVIGGELIKRTSETVDARWFAPNDLPGRMNLFVKDAIQDTFLLSSSTKEVIKRIPFGIVILRRIALFLRNFRNKYLRKPT